MIIDKWVKKYIEKKKEKAVDKTRLENWSKLYEKLHGYTPHCGYCAKYDECISKYKKISGLPRINNVMSCRDFKSDGKDRIRGYYVSGYSGVSGFIGPLGYSGNGQKTGTWQPPWNRGSQSCNKICNSCSYSVGNKCTKP